MIMFDGFPEALDSNIVYCTSFSNLIIHPIRAKILPSSVRVADLEYSVVCHCCVKYTHAPFLPMELLMPQTIIFCCKKPSILSMIWNGLSSVNDVISRFSVFPGFGAYHEVTHGMQSN
jgi:hypothetical protein